MATWDEIRTTIDKEFDRLHQLYDKELRPSTEKFLIETLRTTSERLARLADDLESNRQQRGQEESFKQKAG
jgi:hypothetical protein